MTVMYKEFRKIRKKEMKNLVKNKKLTHKINPL